MFFFCNLNWRRPPPSAEDAGQQRFLSLMEKSIQGVLIVDADWTPLYVNRTGARAFGYEPSDILRWGSIAPLFADHERHRLRRAEVARHAGNETAGKGEVQAIHRDGSTVWLQVQSDLIDWDGKQATLNTMVDITERKLAEQALSKSEAQFRSLIENSQDIITIIDDHAIIRYESPSVAHILGYAPEELIGRPCLELVHPDDIERCTVAMVDMSATPGIRHTLQFRFRHKNGSWRNIEANGKAVIGSDGRLQGILNSRDITARIRAEKGQRRFMDAIDRVSQGFSLWDADDRLVFFNQYYRDLHGDAGEILREGVAFETTLRAFVEHGLYSEAAGREEAFIAERLESHRAGSANFVVRSQDRWLRVQEEQLPDGSTILTKRDISDQVKSDRALRETETRLQAILDNTAALIYLKDLDGRYVLCNRRLQELVGDRTVIGATDHELTMNDLADIRVENDRKVIESGEATEYEETVRLPDGSVHTFLSTKFPLVDEHGAVYAVGGISSDITPRKKAEQSLRQSEEKFRNLIEGSIQGVLIHQGGRHVYVNPATAEIYGCSVEEMLEKTVDEIIWPDDRDRLREYREARLRGEPAPSRYEFRGMRKDGSPVWLELLARLIEWDGEPAYQITMMDIDNRKHAERVMQEMTRQLRREKERAEEANRAKSAFLANMGHELRTPLNAIIGFSDIMQQEMLGPLTGKYGEYSADINRSAEHLLGIINDILDLSKIEAGKLELDEQHVNVRKALHSAERIIAPRAAEMEIRFSRTVPEDVPFLFADERALKQILINLLSNAVKFTEAGGEIHLKVDADKDGMTFEVRDTGIGIAADELQSIFRPFQQGAGGASKQEGTGLGLSLVKSLTDLHGGGVSMESKPGVGTTVRISFPSHRIVDTDEFAKQSTAE